MKRITSSENQIFKAVAQLKLKKFRDEQKKYLIEGSTLIEEAMKSGGEIEMVIRSEEFECGKIDVPTAVMPSGLFHKLSDTETPQGILAIVKKRIYSQEQFFFPNSDKTVGIETVPIRQMTASNLILLDRLQDPGNIGTILRTADAAGYLGAIIMKGTADVYSPKIVRAAAGSLFRLPVLMVDTPNQAIELLKKYKKKIICTTPNCSRYYYDIDMRKHMTVIIGNEGNGACDEFLINSDLQVKIPMEGNIESLNAAISAGILMYESVRQRYQG